MILLLAGNITTTNLLTNAIWSFEEQGIIENVRSGDVNRKKAIEEVLRYRSPIQEIQHVVREDIELGGQQIEAGEIVNIWVGAANRDPEVFDDPESFRPEAHGLEPVIMRGNGRQRWAGFFKYIIRAGILT
ncbi:hypothetical protein A4G99_16315 [Haladaptatus sp. R4]|nr:cytochrome P450 [Haladaptatus sp. R4]KZN23073.1 hypothetical protein A4G99_16315 [Haladaptatus sp. R4]